MITKKAREMITEWRPEDHIEDEVKPTSEARKAASRAGLVHARAALNAVASERSIRRSKMILAAMEQGATDRDLARWLGIQLQSVPPTKSRARRRVKAAGQK